LGSERTAAAIALALALVSRAAYADGGGESTYGRLEGDVSWSAGAGAVVAPRGVRAVGDLRLRYLDTVGLFASYEDSIVDDSGVEPQRVVAGGLELRPFFLYRWLRGYETRRGYVDLTLDSLGLELGAFVASEHGSDFGDSGIELGLGLEVPIERSAAGLWIGLHPGVRWSTTTLGTGHVEGPASREAYLAVTVALHEVVTAHVVDYSDRAPR
jgi:hypothetical protein